MVNPVVLVIVLVLWARRDERLSGRDSVKIGDLGAGKRLRRDESQSSAGLAKFALKSAPMLASDSLATES
jgi:hypothetical protein